VEDFRSRFPESYYKIEINHLDYYLSIPSFPQFSFDEYFPAFDIEKYNSFKSNEEKLIFLDKSITEEQFKKSLSHEIDVVKIASKALAQRGTLYMNSALTNRELTAQPALFFIEQAPYKPAFIPLPKPAFFGKKRVSFYTKKYQLTPNENWTWKYRGSCEINFFQEKGILLTRTFSQKYKKNLTRNFAFEKTFYYHLIEKYLTNEIDQENFESSFVVHFQKIVEKWENLEKPLDSTTNFYQEAEFTSLMEILVEIKSLFEPPTLKKNKDWKFKEKLRTIFSKLKDWK
jgi:hypothetical protein